MKKDAILMNQKGFTLVEIIAVLIILGILAAVAVPRYIDLEANAKARAIDAAVSELSGRESLVWADVKISTSGWSQITDSGVLTRMTNTSKGGLAQPNLGDDYIFTSFGATGGVLSFKGQNPGVTLTRTPSTDTAPGTWKK